MMPKVPFSQSPTGQPIPMVNPTYLAMAAAEFVAEAKSAPSGAKAPNQEPSDAPTDRS